MAIDKIFKSSNVDDLADNILSEVDDFMVSVDKMQQRKVAGNVQKVIQAFKQIETDLQDRYDNVTDVLEKRVSTIKDGRDGVNGTDGRSGRDGKPGRDGINGKQGAPGTPGKDGEDGLDGVSVTNANIDFDGSLVISLSSGQQINVGEIVPPELERQLVEFRQGGGSAGSSGDVMGPTSSTDNAIVRFDGTTGKVVQNSVVTIDDTGNTNFAQTPVLYSGDGTVNSGRLIGRYSYRTATPTTAYFYDFNNSNTITSADSLSATKLATLINSTVTNANALTAYGTSYGAKAAGLSFISGTASDILLASVASPPLLNADINAVVVGYTSVGPRIAIQNYALNDDTANAINYVGAVHRFYPAGSAVATIDSTGLAVTGTLDSTSTATVNSANSTSVALVVKGETGNGIRQRFIGQAASGQYNWQIGASITVAGNFEIIPSTAVDGTTFSTAVGKFSTTGLAVTGTLSATSSSAQEIATFAHPSTSTTANNGGALVRIQNTSSTNGNMQSLHFTNASGSATSAIFGYNADQTTNEGFLTFGTRNSAGTFGERMRLDSSGNLGIGTSSPAAVTGFSSSRTVVQVTSSSGYGQLRLGGAVGTMIDHDNGGNTATTIRNLYGATSNDAVMLIESGYIALRTGTSYTERLRIPAAGGVQAVTTISVGNATPSASGAGITFPATQSASTDANTLDDYEEGTWTPDQGGGLTVVGAFSSSGTYTKIGRLVTFRGVVSGATSIAVNAAGVICTNFPFSAATIFTGTIMNDSANVSGGVYINAVTIVATTTFAATPSLFFSATCFV